MSDGERLTKPRPTSPSPIGGRVDDINQPRRAALRPIEQVTPAFLLCVGRVLDLEPPGACVIRIFKALRHDPLEVVRTHQLEELAASADDAQRPGDRRRFRRQNSLQQPPPLAEWQRPQVGAIEPENVEGDIGGRLRARSRS